MDYIEKDENNFDKLKSKLIESKKIFQIVYSSTYPEVYSFVEKWGIDLRNCFHFKIKEWKDKNNTPKNPLIASFCPRRKSCLLHHPRVQCKKNLWQMRIMKTRKNCRWTKTRRDGRKKNKQEKNEDARSRQKARSWGE